MNRAERRAVTPELVLDVASSVFTDNGYSATTLDKVAALVGVTRQGILHYFPSKGELFSAVLERDKEWARRQSFTGSDDGSALTPLRAFIGGTAEAREHIRLFHVLTGEAVAGNEVAQRFVGERAKVIRQQVRARVSSTTLAGTWSVDTATDAIVALIQGLQSLALLEPEADVVAAFDTFVANVEVFS